MLSQRFYYALKPYLPWGVRMGVRRVVARRKRAASQAVWPIDEAAAPAPAGWPGWPDGKKFAFVLTHDVEGPEGLAKCQGLAELEEKRAFRSSFNFIPAGPYAVAPELRTWLADHGFEVGIHDLEHDGMLFQSWRGFERKAVRINRYLREWGASGFRSGFMLRNLDWLHRLDIAYDCSTFDTDPFELQSEGTGTIFPFWIPVPAPLTTTDAQRGYVELPYTLPQDSTLFLLLKEQSPEIWMRKLDWIVGHGGMVLVNVHPDYINLAGTRMTDREYPESFYTEFLRYVSERYAGQYWNPLPRELASWYDRARRTVIRAAINAKTGGERMMGTVAGRSGVGLRGKRAAAIQFSPYPFDPRPRRAAEALVEAGMEVDLLCLAKGQGEPPEELIRGVRVFRVSLKRQRGGKLSYFWQYGRFFFSAFWFLTRRGLRRRYDVVHVHNMPDFLVFAALLPKLSGASIILDLHDPMPELMATIRGMNPATWQLRLLKTLERWSIGFANAALTPNIAFKNIFAGRSCRPEKMSIVMNSPEEKIFDPARFGPAPAHTGNPGVFRIMHHGLIAWRHGVDLLVEAVARVRPAIPGVRLDIYGSPTPFLTTVLETAKRLGVADIVTFHGEKEQVDIARAILESDLGVIPNRRTVFTDVNFPTRIFEYLALNRPVIAPATRGIKDYFTSDQLPMFEPDDVADLAAKILWVRDQPAAARDTVERGVRIYRDHLWTAEKSRYLSLVGDLVLGPPPDRPKRICMVTHSFYETDNRVTRYAEALAARGDHVDVFALRRSDKLPAQEVIEGVHLYRIQHRLGKDERSKATYVWRWFRFLVVSSWWITRSHSRQPYDLVHVHNLPDFLVFAAWYPRFTGARLILDVHDIVPEFYASKFSAGHRSPVPALLRLMERLSARFVHHVIISNHLWLDKYAGRTGMQGRCSVFINNVNARVFQPHLRARHDQKMIILFPGGLQWHQGLDIALRAFTQVSRELPLAEFHIYGDGNMKPALVALASELGFNGKVKFFEPVRIVEIAQIMADADLGVVPKRADSFGNEAYSTKIMEFMSVGVPVVVSKTKIDQYYFDDSMVRFFESGNADDLAQAMLGVLRDAGLRARLVANASEYSARHSWESRKTDYLQLVNSLSLPRSARPDAS